jgi:hypothetical protein
MIGAGYGGGVRTNGRWVPIEGRGVQVRYGGLLPYAVIKTNGGTGERMEMSLGPVQDLLWVLLPEARDGLTDEVVSLLDNGVDYGRLLNWTSWYSPIRQLRYALEAATAESSADPVAAARICTVLRRVLELNDALGDYYLEPIQSQLHEHMDESVLARLGSVDARVVAQLADLAPGVKSDPPLPAPFVPRLAPPGDHSRGWLEVKLGTGSVVRTRFGGIISATAFGIGTPSADLDNEVGDIGIGPFEDALWVSLPEYRPILAQFLRRELNEAMAADRGLRSLSPYALCRRLFDVVLLPALAELSPDDLLQRCLTAVQELIHLADHLRDPHRDALKTEICAPLAAGSPRSTLAVRAPKQLATIDRFLAGQ